MLAAGWRGEPNGQENLRDQIHFLRGAQAAGLLAIAHGRNWPDATSRGDPRESALWGKPENIYSH